MGPMSTFVLWVAPLPSQPSTTHWFTPPPLLGIHPWCHAIPGSLRPGLSKGFNPPTPLSHALRAHCSFWTLQVCASVPLHCLLSVLEMPFFTPQVSKLSLMTSQANRCFGFCFVCCCCCFLFSWLLEHFVYTCILDLVLSISLMSVSPCFL